MIYFIIFAIVANIFMAIKQSKVKKQCTVNDRYGRLRTTYDNNVMTELGVASMMEFFVLLFLYLINLETELVVSIILSVVIDIVIIILGLVKNNEQIKQAAQFVKNEKKEVKREASAKKKKDIENTCPKCHKVGGLRSHSRTVDERYVGTHTEWDRSFEREVVINDYERTYYEYKQCKYCGYKTEEKGPYYGDEHY